MVKVITKNSTHRTSSFELNVSNASSVILSYSHSLKCKGNIRLFFISPTAPPFPSPPNGYPSTVRANPNLGSSHSQIDPSSLHAPLLSFDSFASACLTPHSPSLMIEHQTCFHLFSKLNASTTRLTSVRRRKPILLSNRKFKKQIESRRGRDHPNLTRLQSLCHHI